MLAKETKRGDNCEIMNRDDTGPDPFHRGECNSDETHQMLLGFPCAPEEHDEIVGAIDALTDEQRSLVYEWAMFPLNTLPEWAYDRLKNYLEQNPKHEPVNPVAQESLDEYFSGLIAWLDIIGASDSVPILVPDEPDYADYETVKTTSVGEDLEMLTWKLIKGGAQDQLLAEQVAFLILHMEKYRQFALGEARMIMMPQTIYERMPSETEAERITRESGETTEAVIKLLEFLAPAIEANRKIFEELGIDPFTGEMVNQ